MLHSRWCVGDLVTQRPENPKVIQLQGSLALAAGQYPHQRDFSLSSYGLRWQLEKPSVAGRLTHSHQERESVLHPVFSHQYVAKH